MAPIKLTYFDIRARAEVIRLALVYGGLEYDDERITLFSDEWLQIKKRKRG